MAVDGLAKDQVQPFIAAVLTNVERGTTNLHQDTWIALQDAALTFDGFHNMIAPEDRKKIIDWMNAHLEKYTADENAFHNSTLSKILTYLRVAYATWGENPRAKEFRDYAIDKLYRGKVVPVLKQFGEGGGFTECGWYSRGSLWHLVQALELARRFEKNDGFQEAPSFFYQRLAYEMYQPYPGLWTYGSQRYPVEGDGANTYGGHNEYPRHLRTMLAQYFRGSELSRYVATQKRKGSNLMARLTDFLYEEPADPPADLKTLPLAHLAAGIGKVYARSDWTDDATWFRFECGDFWNHHQHFETGNFEIFRYEPLATESGEYTDYNSSHSVNWLIRTVAHNCILVHQLDEKWTNLRDGGRSPYANDGGQAKKWDWPVDTVEQWNKKREQFERGRIVAYENQPAFLYVAGDCTKAYAASKLSNWTRQIVFIRPATFVILDRVVSTRAEYAKTWLLHCKNEPQIDGTTTTTTDGKGKLTAVTLLPAKPVIRKIEGYQYGGQTFDAPKSALTPLAAKWRIEVQPPGQETEDLFLHVLFTDKPQEASLVREGKVVGVKIGTTEVLFDASGAKAGGTLTIEGKQSPLAQEVKKGKFE